MVAISDGDTVTLLDSAKQQHLNPLAGSMPEKSIPFESALEGNICLTWCSARRSRSRLREGGSSTSGVCKIAVNGTDTNLEQIKGRAGVVVSEIHAKDQSKVDRAASLPPNRMPGR